MVKLKKILVAQIGTNMKISYNLPLYKVLAALAKTSERNAECAIECDGALVDGQDVGDPHMTVGTVTFEIDIKSLRWTTVSPGKELMTPENLDNFDW